MVTLLFCLAACPIQAQDIQLGTVDIGGRQVAIIFPATKGPYDESTPHVEVGGYKYVVGRDLNLQARYLVDGGWGEVTSKYASISAKAASAPEYRVKVILFSTGEIIEETEVGTFRRRRGFLSTADVDAIYSSLARFKAIAEVAAGGGCHVTFDVTLDEDLLFRKFSGEFFEYTGDSSNIGFISVDQLSESTSLLGTEFVRDEIAPVINNGRFESEDQRYRGPYSSVFAIHSLPTPGLDRFILDRTPVTALSWFRYSGARAGEALSLELFREFAMHLVASSRASAFDVAASIGWPNHNDFPNIAEFPLSDGLIKTGNHFSSPFSENGETIGLIPLPLESKSVQQPVASRIVSVGDGMVRIDPLLASAFASKHPGATMLKRIKHEFGGWDWIVFDAPGVSFQNDLEALGLSEQASQSAQLFSEASETSVPVQIADWGERFKVEFSDASQTEIDWLKAVNSPLESNDVARFRLILAGNDIDLRLNALGALGRIDTQELTTDLGVSAMSASPSESFLAIEALQRRKDNGAWSQIASTALRGPFGHNYRFATEALLAKPEDVTVDLLSSAMFDRSRHSRRAAALTLSMIDSPKADLLAPFILDDPDPRVRITAAYGPRAKKKGFANRLAWSAVNDESEWVRAACSLALLSSEDAEIRKLAFSAVRDEGESVRLAVLRAMTTSPRDEFRQSLRAAVVDRSAAVRAAALRAFSTQPGPVVAAEVQNTFNDPSPHVKAALADLANTKGIKLP